MPDEVYRKLARRLNAIPNGFATTESGVELRLLAKMFTAEEAKLASVMRLSAEPAADITGRAGADPARAERTLKAMTRKGLIRAERGKGRLTFGLIPFVVGSYENQLPRMDAEMAELFERYFQETRGAGIVESAPPIHRVLAVEESIPFRLEIHPYERASALLEGARSWGVRDCICRVQQRLIGKACDHPVENCLVFAPVEGAFDHSQVDRAITKEEALRILREAEESGLVHTTGNYRGQHNYICNCCTCSCGILRSLAEFEVPNAVANSGFQAVVRADTCAGCADCVDRCQFGAISVPEDAAIVDYARCVGCGLCATTCPTDSLQLERRTGDQFAPPPKDRRDWMIRRARARGISMFDIE